MDIFQILSLLKVLGTAAAGLAIACAVPAIIITRNHTPKQLKQIIQEEALLLDPKRRKAVLVQSPEESAQMKELFQLPDTHHIFGWQGNVREDRYCEKTQKPNTVAAPVCLPDPQPLELFSQ